MALDLSKEIVEREMPIQPKPKRGTRLKRKETECTWVTQRQLSLVKHHSKRWVFVTTYVLKSCKFQSGGAKASLVVMLPKLDLH